MSIDVNDVKELVAEIRGYSPHVNVRPLSQAVYAHFAYGADIVYLVTLYNGDWSKIMAKCSKYTRPHLDATEQMELRTAVDEWLASEEPDGLSYRF